VKTIRLSKGTEGLLLGLWTIIVLFVTMLVQGGSGVRTNLAPFEDVIRLAYRASRGGVLSNAFLYAVVGIVGNLVMFAIWAFLAWKFLDGPGRTAARNHVDVAFAGTLFSVGIETVQLFLPTRAADVNDVFWNVMGTLVGSALAHVSRNVKVVWE
jgi:glycopeptide antibiotics resistance protein